MSGETVVLLHGLGRTRRSLAGLKRALDDAGYTTWSRTYPSRRMTIADLADEVAGWIREDLGEGPHLAVTHSMGGVVLRHLADRLTWRRSVMLAPPNRGSRVARTLHRNGLFRWWFGPAVDQLASPTDWPIPTWPCAVIAGTAGTTLNNVPSWGIRALRIMPTDTPHDGTVAVDEARLPGMTDFATVAASHTWIMNHPDTRRLILGYLQGAGFTPPTP